MLEKNEMCSELTSENAENGNARAGKGEPFLREAGTKESEHKSFGFGEGLYYSVKWGVWLLLSG